MQNIMMLYSNFNTLTAGPDSTCTVYSLFPSFYEHAKYQLLNMIKIKRDINQQDFKIVDLYSVNSE